MVVNVLDAWCVITELLTGSGLSAQAGRPPRSTTGPTARDTSQPRGVGTRRGQWATVPGRSDAFGGLNDSPEGESTFPPTL